LRLTLLQQSLKKPFLQPLTKMTIYKILFSDIALNDIKSAKGWYNLQQKGLGKKLATDIKATSSAIQRNPFFSSVRYRDIRKASCKKFPYAIHYKVYEDQKLVFVTAVFHESRKPLT